MDQLKIVLAVLKKHYFWPLSVVVIVVAMASWSVAKAKLTAQYKVREKTLTGQFSSVQQVAAQAEHPNEALIKTIQDKTTNLKKSVLDAWTMLYNEQKAKNTLPERLSQEFKNRFDALKPGDELPTMYRAEYQNFIQDNIPKLVAIVDPLNVADERDPSAGKTGAEKPPVPFGAKPARSATIAAKGKSATDATAPAAAEQRGVVQWDQADRQRLYERCNWKETPTTLQVRLAQEDLWVYEALLRIIKSTNQGATSNYNASIRQIVTLQIGRDAADVWQSGRGKILSSIGGTDAGAPGAGGAAAGGPAAAGSDSGKTSDAALLASRYVNADGVPLAADAPSPFAEFKMMPVRMVVVVDQRSLHKLLVECANSTMPVEVRTVRFPADTGKQAPTSVGGGAATRGEGSPSSDSQEANSNYLSVEVLGIIHIFNPPDKDKLGTGAAGKEPSGTTAAAVPPMPVANTPPPAVPAVPPGGDQPAAPVSRPPR